MKRAYLVVCYALAIAAVSKGQVVDHKSDHLPAGNWMFRAGPVLERGFPIDVYGVYTSAERRLSIDFVEVKNYSASPISRIRVGWTFMSEDVVVATGSVTLELTEPLKPKNRYRITHPFVNLRQLIGRTARLSGNYRLEVSAIAVSEAEATASQPGPVIQAFWIGNGDDGSEDDGWGRGCQNQNCTWSQEDGSYRCSQLTGYRCKVDDDGQGCYERRCPQ
jgi:hypothetical protein